MTFLISSKCDVKCSSYCLSGYWHDAFTVKKYTKVDLPDDVMLETTIYVLDIAFLGILWLVISSTIGFFVVAFALRQIRAPQPLD